MNYESRNRQEITRPGHSQRIRSRAHFSAKPNNVIACRCPKCEVARTIRECKCVRCRIESNSPPRHYRQECFQHRDKCAGRVVAKWQSIRARRHPKRDNQCVIILIDDVVRITHDRIRQLNSYILYTIVVFEIQIPSDIIFRLAFIRTIQEYTTRCLGWYV